MQRHDSHRLCGFLLAVTLAAVAVLSLFVAPGMVSLFFALEFLISGSEVFPPSPFCGI